MARESTKLRRSREMGKRNLKLLEFLTKKKIAIILTIFLIVIVGCLAIINLLTKSGTQEYTSTYTGITLNVPNLSIFKEECCMFSVNFENIRSVSSLRQEIEEELENYEKITCNGKTYYYNREQDFTINEYYIGRGFIFNWFSIVYDMGNYCYEK